MHSGRKRSMENNAAAAAAAARVKKGAWTAEEDLKLTECINEYGEGKWHLVPCRAGLNRCRKSCRQRWLNYLRPDIKRGSFHEDEVDLIIRLHKLLGNRWSLIAGRLPGRTANAVKNFWNTRFTCRKPLLPSIAIPDGETNNNHSRIERITSTKVAKPRPWLLSKFTAPTQPVAKYVNLSKDDIDEFANAPLAGTNCVEYLKYGDPTCSSPTPEGAYEGVLWWSNLLEVAKSGERMLNHRLPSYTPFSVGHDDDHGG